MLLLTQAVKAAGPSCAASSAPSSASAPLPQRSIRAIFYNENRVLSVSVLLDGKYGQHDVYASVPAIVGRDGIAEIIELHLTPEEQEKFNASCKTMSENYQLSLTL